MGCQESDFGCEKHSGHGQQQQQQQGICPACLRERLLYVASIQSCTTTTSSCSSSPSSSSPRLPPCYSPASTSSSACASPPHRRRASDFSCSIGFIMGEGTGGGNNGLSKSRSVAFVANAGGRKKKGGFWSKLLRLPGKRTKEAFGHSRNFKDGFEYYNY
ncbi:hypothetical protein RHMOL_Rhmol10G0248000 [Rhododendron molle]|uniref:Uncharacterized protein n=1 Tax=Rhododendron molle TaxID=49168 RepID=A0ACC0M6V3_RHOML|nr:hypothetical protein RHMOL_Rhmol10G0248000 [Rhododendron molle]